MYDYCCNNLLPAVEIHRHSCNSYSVCDELVYHLLLQLKRNKEVIMYTRTTSTYISKYILCVIRKNLKRIYMC